MRVDGLDERAVAPWRELLDATERERAARFVFARNRVEFIAAHALARAALALTFGVSPTEWDFVADAQGKPAPLLGGKPAPLSFNLSHTTGMVGLAVVAGANRALGFDLEKLDRELTMDIADRYFTAQEVAWLYALPGAERSRGFLRLWTLKEAFIKATGKGLTDDLASFWFVPSPPRIHFLSYLGEDESAWGFEQRLIDGSFVAAVGLRHASPFAVRWTAVDAAQLGPSGLAC